MKVGKHIRVQFAHGLEGSPAGNKARLFDGHFCAQTPAMDTTDFEGCVSLHASVLGDFRPHVLVGSSFGGAVVVELLARGLHTGPTLLLAQAARLMHPTASLPAGVPVCLVHAPNDEVVPMEGSRELAAGADPDLVELIEVHDDHGLHHFTQSGALEQAVIRLYDRYCKAP